jgi:hypothetical protein
MLFDPDYLVLQHIVREAPGKGEDVLFCTAQMMEAA